MALACDKLLSATGEGSVRPKEQRPRTAVIVGAGYTGIETSEALTKRGVAVGVVEMGPAVPQLPLGPSDALRPGVCSRGDSTATAIAGGAL